MRRTLIGYILPGLLCLLPFLAAALILMCIPHRAMTYFLDHFGLMEVLITGGGLKAPLVVVGVFPAGEFQIDLSIGPLAPGTYQSLVLVREIQPFVQTDSV